MKSGNNAQSGSLPGWGEVKPFQEDARFWHSLWRSAGKPNRGAIYSFMADTRNKFHYAVRRARKNADLVRAKRLFEASEVGCMDLLKEMKDIRNGGKGKCSDLPDNVAGANGEE